MQETLPELRRFRRDVEYYEAHREQLLQQYPEQWVAVFNQEIVGADPDFERLLATLDELGVPSEHALIRRVTARDDLLILPL
ncbi:MAG: hypothetical protein HY690_07960 [Chloroflexi bacterium]|nr:hypothetical protein [Chloroflexota bacterium]